MDGLSMVRDFETKANTLKFLALFQNCFGAVFSTMIFFKYLQVVEVATIQRRQ